MNVRRPQEVFVKRDIDTHTNTVNINQANEPFVVSAFGRRKNIKENTIFQFINMFVYLDVWGKHKKKNLIQYYMTSCVHNMT